MNYIDARCSVSAVIMNLTLVSADRAQILILFYKPTSTDPLMNRVVAHFSPPFCHVELAFPERYGDEPWECDIYGSSIFQDETVFFKRKTYARDGYVCLTIEVSHIQQLRVKHYCRQQSDAGVSFNKWAMYGAYVPIFRSDHGTFCSKYITNALQYGCILDPSTIDASRTTPSGLHSLLCDKAMAAPIVQVVPSRMQKPISERGRQACLNIIAMQPAPPVVPSNDMLTILQRRAAHRKANAHCELTSNLTNAMTQSLYLGQYRATAGAGAAAAAATPVSA